MTDCFVHASDLHLDAPLGDLGNIDSTDRDRLAALAAGAWDQLVQTTIQRDASFLVLAGDIFHKEIAHFGAQQVFHDGLDLLGEAEVKVFICHGNHDPLTDKMINIRDFDPDKVVVFPSGVPTFETVSLRHSGAMAHVSGLSFSKTEETDNLAIKFRDLDPGPGPHVAVLHANLDGSDKDGDHDPYAPCTLADLKDSSVDYWALGHIHLRRVEPIGPGRFAAYCGNLQGRMAKPAECHPKGALVVPIDSGRIGEPEFVACDRVRFTLDEIEVTPDDGMAEICDRLQEKASSAGVTAEERPVVWTVTLTGRHPEPEAIQRLIDEGGLPNDLPTRLNDGALRLCESKVRRLHGSEEVVASGGFGQQVLDSLSSDDARSMLEELVNDMPSAIRQSLRPVDKIGVRSGTAELTEELIDDILPLAEDLVLKYLTEDHGA